jgi:hypothetical protein
MDIGEVPGSLVQPGESIFGRNNQLIGRFGNISGHAKSPRGFSPSARISLSHANGWEPTQERPRYQ